jgi:eight-cysteine-cluster-containing protein
MARNRIKLTDKQIYMVLIAMLTVVGIIGIAAQNMAVSGPPFTEEQSLEIARNAVLNSPTYLFDGYELQHVRTLAAGSPGCWSFGFEFSSSHAGYGDREGLMVAQVVTPHTATVMVERGEIKSASMDGRWDVIKQGYLPGLEPAAPPAGDDTGGDAGMANETPVDDSGPTGGEPPINDTSPPAAGFCGWSTNASCNSDAGCKTGGCSSQVCISLAQFSMITTCEWRDCYDASAYGLECRCVDGTCQWTE